MTMHGGLSDSTLLSQVITPQNAATVINSAAIDMAGFDGIRFEINLGAMNSGATLDALIQRSALANFASGIVNVPNAALVQVANTGNSNVAIIDVYKPQSRYVRIQATPATSYVYLGVTATRYRANGSLPPTQVASQYVLVQEG